MPSTATTATRALERLRRLCLGLPETSEVMAWGHPVFKAGARTFAAIEPIDGRASMAFRLEPVDVDLLLRRESFFDTPYGRGLWVSAWADATLDPALVSSLVERSYRIVALRRMLAALDAEVPPAGTPTKATRVRGAR